MSSNRSDNRLSAPTPSEGATSFEPIWRFEPSAASEAVWANDLLVETIYRHVYQQGYMKDMDDLEGLGDVINGMLLCKSRFWLIAKIRWEKSWFDELLGQLKSGASLDRFVAICRSVKVLYEDDEVFRRNIRESGSAVTPQYLRRYSSLLPNLKIIRTWDTGIGMTDDAIVYSFECDGQPILVELLDCLSIPPSWECNHASASGITCCYSLDSIEIADYRRGPALVDSLKVLMDSLKALIAETQGVSKEIAFTGPLGQLRSLKFLLLPPRKESHGAFSLSELHALLDACPELRLLACRLEGSAAIHATEETLDRIFVKGKHIKSISIDTPGRFVPYLRCLARFEEVTLSCKYSLRGIDVEMSESRIDMDPPFMPQMKSFTIVLTVEYLSFLLLAKEPTLPVATVIRSLLPPDCRVTVERSPERYTQSMLHWWRELSTTLKEFEKAKLETRLPVRSFVPMTPEEIADRLQSNGG